MSDCYCYTLPEPDECSYCIEQSELSQLRAENQLLKEALSDLIAAQAYKEEHGKDELYKLVREAAWFQAKQVIAQANKEAGDD